MSSSWLERSTFRTWEGEGFDSWQRWFSPNGLTFVMKHVAQSAPIFFVSFYVSSFIIFKREREIGLFILPCLVHGLKNCFRK